MPLTDEDLVGLVDDSVSKLKLTTSGYVGHPASWYTNTLTYWYAAMQDLKALKDALKARHSIKVTLSMQNTQVGTKITTNISAL